MTVGNITIEDFEASINELDLIGSEEIKVKLKDGTIIDISPNIERNNDTIILVQNTVGEAASNRSNKTKV